MIGLSASQVQAELIARYTFDDGTVNDSVGSFHATLTETDYPAVVFEAERGYVLELDSAAGYIEYPQWATNQVEFTYALWVKQIPPILTGHRSLIANTT